MNPPASPVIGFPHNFAWGAATSAYQIEGATRADGRGDSVWDMMGRQPGKIWEGHTGDLACDHYHRASADVAVMKQIGLQAYRFSIAWPRILPDGVGSVNDQGLDFYDRLTDDLLAAGIAPWVTLFHWDYPRTLFLRGGWMNPDSPRWFADYVQVVAERLSDRVSHWITLNEPQCFIWYGHVTGMHAPGIQFGLAEAALAGHHVLLAHGLATQVLRALGTPETQVGFSPVGIVGYPASDSPADIAAARRATMAIDSPTLWSNTWWADPIFRGAYPADGLEKLGAAAPPHTEAELAIIAQPLDFYGINVYEGFAVTAGRDDLPVRVPSAPGHAQTHFGWRVTPEALYWAPRFIYERYQCPIVVTENGLSTNDWVGLDGKVPDAQRIDFLTRYLQSLRRASADGIDVRGYFHWSLMDNFEWAEGYKQRFGLVHVDYQTQKRTLKESAYWYKKVICSNGEILP